MHSSRPAHSPGRRGCCDLVPGGGGRCCDLVPGGREVLWHGPRGREVLWPGPRVRAGAEVLWSGPWSTPPPPFSDRMTNTCVNITFARFATRAVNIEDVNLYSFLDFMGHESQPLRWICVKSVLCLMLGMEWSGAFATYYLLPLVTCT